MAKITKKSSLLQENYSFEDENLIGNFNVQKDVVAGTVTNINGQMYRLVDGKQGDYVGNFTGSLRNGEMKYCLSEMTKEDSALMWTAIEEIEAALAE